MESVSEKTERNTSEDKFNSKVLIEKPTTSEPVADINEHANDAHLEAMAELHNRAIIIEENGREEKRPKLENLPDTEDHETVDINSVSEGKENNIMITSETNIEQNLKPEEERDQEKQQIFETFNRYLKPERQHLYCSPKVPTLLVSYCLKFFIKTKLFIPQLVYKCFLKAKRNNRSITLLQIHLGKQRSTKRR